MSITKTGTTANVMLANAFRRFLARRAGIRRRTQDRRHLENLTAELLTDIGLTRSDIRMPPAERPTPPSP